MIIVRRIQAPADVEAPPSDDAVSVEAGLLQPSTHLLRDFPQEGMRQEYRDHLVRRLRRNPRELRTHVERLLLARADADREGTYAALSDLFNVLHQSGGALRARLLRAAAPLLSREQKREFLDRLMHSEAHHDAMPAHAGVEKAVPVVIEREEGRIVHRDLRTMARDASRAGDPAAAMALLEAAIDRDPGDREANLALLALLEDPSMREPLLGARTRLLSRHVAMPERWRNAAAST